MAARCEFFVELASDRSDLAPSEDTDPDLTVTRLSALTLSANALAASLAECAMASAIALASLAAASATKLAGGAFALTFGV